MIDVSRETGAGAPPPTEAATTVFGDRRPLAERYAALLAGRGIERGLLGPRELPRLWDRHVLNCAVVTELMPVGASVADIGSGAGLPGLALAIRRPDLMVTLIEPLLRRSTFLTEAVTALDLDNVQVMRARAEDVRAEFDLVTSRAVAPLAKLARWSLPLVRSEGLMLAMKGASAADEIEATRAVVRQLGGAPAVVHSLGSGLVQPVVTVVEIRKAGGST